MTDSQIVLLPRTDYFAWVDAAKDYASRFGLNVTADPVSAAGFMTPRQTVTIGGQSGGYAGQGDIRRWFRTNYPRIHLDYVACQSPQEFHAALQARLDANQRYLTPGGFRLRWPTDFDILIQGFGEHPEINRRWGLPGNDGLDFFAPRGAKVYSAADGVVAKVDTYHGDPVAMPYGNSATVRHAGGYATLYAHLERALVPVGQSVKAGQPIGLAGATGSGAVDQLHLVLTQAGASAARLTNYPRDVIDPTPYMEWPSPGAGGATTQNYPWPPGYCLVGLHGRADGPLQAADYGPVGQARVEAVKLLSTAQGTDVDALRAQNSRLFIPVRMFASFTGRIVSSADFASWMVGDLAPFYSRGLRYFEVHNEPNLVTEGWTLSWGDGVAFGAWYSDVVNRLRPHFPDALFGFPGLSPGDSIPGLRTAALDFLTGADAACRAADWIGVHCYWVSDQDMTSPTGGLGFLDYRSRFPDKLLFVTEFSNPTVDTTKQTKGQQYQRYYQMLRAIPGLGAAFSFVVSASSGFDSETWRTESGSVTEIPGLVGARSDSITGLPPPPPSG
jgi:murein DD-endopeptidase MepM/ murein hydrolase activator NlpD